MNARRAVSVPLIGVVTAASAWLVAAGAPGCGDPSDGSPSVGEGGIDVAMDAPASEPADAAGAVDAGLEAADFAALVDDPSRWHAVPNPGGCYLQEGNVVPDPFPKRVWSGCGPGCSLTPSGPAFSPPIMATYRITTAADYVNGNVYMTSSFGNKIARLTRLERLPDGDTIAATMTKGQAGTCVLAEGGGSAIGMFLMIGTNADVRYGRAPAQAGDPIAWQNDWRSDAIGGPTRFVFDDGLGVGTPGGPLLMENDSGPVVQLPGGADRIAGRGSLLVWAAGYTPAIHGYTKAKGHVELVPLPGRGAIGVALSDERMFWISAASVNETYTDRRWHWSPRSDDPAGISVHDGPALVGNGFLMEDMKAAGDWAAANHCPVGADLSKCQLVAWNVVTNQTIAVVGRPGFVFVNVLAVTPTEIYLQEAKIVPGALQFDNIVRLEISALPALAAGAGWPQ